MPTYNGITVSIISALEAKQHPEFPHPEGYSFGGGVSPQLSHGDHARKNGTSSSMFGRKSTPSLQSKSSTSLSVYIPSLAGSRFFVRYSVAPPHPDGRQWYFKLLMNGRHIISWGVNPRTMHRGQIMHAFFEADKKWNFKVLKGKSSKETGEMRPFYFSENSTNPSTPAADGGLIEVQVFRANGKRRREPILDTFRPQDSYGIGFRSSGLMEKSARNKFYDFLLEDPRDSPYITFRFHYRSWDSLQMLQLIPENHPRNMLSRSFSQHLLPEFNHEDSRDSESLGSRQSKSRITEGGQVYADNGKHASDFRETSAMDRSFPYTPSKKNLFGVPAYHVESSDYDDNLPGTSHSAPDEETKKSLHIPTSTFSLRAVPQPQKKVWTKSLLDARPLPPLPTEVETQTHSRKSSASSNAIAPSLKDWVSEEDNDLEDAEIGTAEAAKLCTPAEISLEYIRRGRRGAPGDYPANSRSSSIYSSTNNLPQTLKHGITPPADGIFAPPGSPKHSLRQKRSAVLLDGDVLPGLHAEDYEKDPFQDSTSNLEQTQWLTRTPSPTNPGLMIRKHLNSSSPLEDKIRSPDVVLAKGKELEIAYGDDQDEEIGANLISPFRTYIDYNMDERDIEWI